MFSNLRLTLEKCALILVKFPTYPGAGWSGAADELSNVIAGRNVSFEILISAGVSSCHPTYLARPQTSEGGWDDTDNTIISTITGVMRTFFPGTHFKTIPN